MAQQWLLRHNRLGHHFLMSILSLQNVTKDYDPHSAGTFVDARGETTHLRRDEFTLEPEGSTWASPATRAVYPVRWRISVPKFAIALECSTLLPSQELASSAGFVPTYWEGAIVLAGLKGGSPIAGVGYLEMTGYDRPVEALR
ncbi:MAG TPA: lipocalin family protein [Candidatus Acidoferrum sp.]|nr:lipocalin family protein [Candidatus Acidoferrum sp.]